MSQASCGHTHDLPGDKRRGDEPIRVVGGGAGGGSDRAGAGAGLNVPPALISRRPSLPVSSQESLLLVNRDVGIGGFDAVNLLDVVEDALGERAVVLGFDQSEDVGAAPAGVGALDPRDFAQLVDYIAGFPAADIDEYVGFHGGNLLTTATGIVARKSRRDAAEGFDLAFDRRAGGG